MPAGGSARTIRRVLALLTDEQQMLASTAHRMAASAEIGPSDDRVIVNTGGIALGILFRTN